MNGFVHLHIHSEFSLLDGANRIKDLPVRAKELGMNAMAITDHGAMFGAIDFYKACLANGIKPIIGCEVYVAPRKRTDKDPNLDARYNHLILLAKDNEGYKNLTKIVSIGFTEGFYYKPRIDKEVLEKYHEGLVCCSACLAGELPQAILKGDMEEAERVANWFKNLFGEDYYLEIQNNGISEQVLVNQKLIELSKKLNIELVATNDSHYLKKEDAYNHEILLCIQTGKKITDADRMKFDTDELYIKSPEEMSDYFSGVPQAIENTVKIADKCNVTFEFGNTILPNYDVPEEFATHYDYLVKLCDDGIKKRYGEKVYKLPVNLPVTCPNRMDGDGCTFCGGVGTGFEAMNSEVSVSEQLNATKGKITKRYKAKKFIAYFQNYTNTFLPVDKFEKYLVEAAQTEDIVGISVSTRPDCITKEYLDCLKKISEEYQVKISMEYGLQTVNYKTLNKINRGHTLAEYLDAVLMTAPYGFEICTHIILNLPGDDMTDVIETAKILSALPVQIVKLHSLYIPKGSKMYEEYKEGKITLCDPKEYLDRLVNFICYVRKDMVIERLFSRVPKEDASFSNWGISWWKLKDRFDEIMETNDYMQGCKFDYLNGAALRRWEI